MDSKTLLKLYEMGHLSYPANKHSNKLTELGIVF